MGPFISYSVVTVLLVLALLWYGSSQVDHKECAPPPPQVCVCKCQNAEPVVTAESIEISAEWPAMPATFQHSGTKEGGNENVPTLRTGAGQEQAIRLSP